MKFFLHVKTNINSFFYSLSRLLKTPHKLFHTCIGLTNVNQSSVKTESQKYCTMKLKQVKNTNWKICQREIEMSKYLDFSVVTSSYNVIF